uniref:Uncharacterized protein n=1 Tax=mine drainage metagenome TaxID=410659 RepID=E6QJB7_9ZZZZ
MHEITLSQSEAGQVSGKQVHMRRLNRAFVAFALDAPPCSFLEDSTVESSVTAVLSIALHKPALFLKGIEYQFLEYQRIDLAQVGDASRKSFLRVFAYNFRNRDGATPSRILATAMAAFLARLNARKPCATTRYPPV